MKRITKVAPRAGFRLWIRFEGGEEGEVDLSHLAGEGVFAIWQSRQGFERVSIGEFGQLRWGEDIELCPDSLYLRLTGLTGDEALKTGNPLSQHA